MKSLVLGVFLLLGIHYSFAQDIKFKVDNLDSDKAALFSLSGEKVYFIDSITSSKKGKFQFSLENHHAGIYRLTFNNKSQVDFIYDKKDVKIETDANNFSDNVKVIKSESNKIYYDFIKLNKEYKTKTELLYVILARYPRQDDYYQITKEKLVQVQEEYLYFVNVTAQANQNSFIARYVLSVQLPVVDTDFSTENQLKYLKSHSLDNVNFYDDGLIYSDAFSNKTIEYLTYYRNPQLPLELLEKEFIAAIDSILSKAKVNDIIYKHIVEYLLDGFKKYGFDNVINYIVDNYVIKDDICLDEKLETALERRVQQSKNFNVGAAVPNIIIPDSSGLVLELNNINAKKILIIFYASWCPHCQTLLPQILEIYKNQREKKFEVLAISIDTSRTDWLNFVRACNLNWLNANDLRGWDGKSVLDYYIYATPTMFLIDSDRKILMRPTSIEELNIMF